MKRSSQITSLIAVTFIGLAVFRATADESRDKPHPKVVRAKQPQLIAAKPGRTFGSLLHKGQTVTLYQLRQEAPTGYHYQVRIVDDHQKKQIEDVLERDRKESEDYQSKISVLEKEMRETTDRVKQAELREEHEQLRRGYKPRPLPVDIRPDKFYRISDLGYDYVGFERNGVETFHRLSSIHRIIRGVEIVEE